MDFKKGGEKKNPERSLPRAKKMNGPHGLHPRQGRRVLQPRGREDVEEPRKMIVLLGGSRGVRWKYEQAGIYERAGIIFSQLSSMCFCSVSVQT